MDPKPSLEQMTREDAVAEASALRAQLGEMARLADAVPHIVWTTGADGMPTYFNSKWTEYSGADLAETLRVGAGTFVHPDDLGRFVEKTTQARETGAPYEVSYRLRRAQDGAYRWHIARVVPLRVEDGTVTAWAATATDVDDGRRAEQEQSFLVQITKVLGTSLDLSQTLSDVARLVVPGLADWCAIDLMTESGVLDRPAVAHVDPSKVALAWDLYKRFPPKPEDAHSVYSVIRSGQPDILEDIPDELLEAATPDKQLLTLIRSLGLRSSMCVPLLVRDRAIGALTLVSAESGRRYTARDLGFANELAHRIGVAVENARLYGIADRARAAAEAMAADVVEQSREVQAALIAMRTERDAALKRADAGEPGKA